MSSAPRTMRTLAALRPLARPSRTAIPAATAAAAALSMARAPYATATASASATAAPHAHAHANAAIADTSTHPDTPRKLPMTWTEYFAKRKTRKLWSTLSTIPSSVAGLVGGGAYIANMDVDLTQPIVGLDPTLVLGASTIACMGLGYLLGPMVGNGLFSLTHPKLTRGNPPPLDVMDREFYHRIKTRRADPSHQNVNNIVPDFFGEKVTSLHAYRRWLKDQKAYLRKAAHGVDELD